MALKNYNPTSPARRGLILVDRSALWKGKPVKALTEGKERLRAVYMPGDPHGCAIHGDGGRPNVGPSRQSEQTGLIYKARSLNLVRERTRPAKPFACHPRFR